MKVHVAFVLGFCSCLTQLAAALVASQNATNFPMIGITSGQTLQLNLGAVPPDPCFAQLGFRNGSRNPVGTTIAVILQPGQSASLPSTAIVFPTYLDGECRCFPR
jgi:hypothetical protein